ncbi:transcriptional regulator [Streptomyces tateyamensis]|uniref:Transcriptional regulator n=1 Tax=Streptomyces tateyamensis TaxID=565073 RepID=A0A2V4N4F8_9ACTN|nr:LCP family protein [Streptomyces tateyamensis]PYC76103.1 transcriptional regulator [Streptomyces tateyamensis]
MSGQRPGAFDDAGDRRDLSAAAPRPGGRRAAREAAAEPVRPSGRAEARRAQAKGGRGRKKQGKRNRKKVVAWTAAASVVLITAAGGALYTYFNGNISSFDAAGISTDRPPAATADANGNKPVNVLLIGSDSRGNGNSDLGGGGDAGARSDTTILLHVYADHKHAVGVSFPRDSLVEIPPCLVNGKWTKTQPNAMFNSAFSMGNTDKGNPACTQNAVEHLTGMRVDHTLVVDFNGFASMTSAVGGVDVCLPNAVYEGDLNPNLGHKGNLIFSKGVQQVSGQKALDYVRVRHGIGDGSDIGRMQRQQAFLSALIKKVKGSGMDPTTLLPLANAATKSLTVDPDLASADKLLGFAMSMKNIDLHNIKFITTPWRFEGARVAWVHPDVDNLWAALKADRTLDGQDASGGQRPDAPSGSPAAASSPAAPAAAPGSVNGAGARVTVYNGTTTKGLTVTASAKLKDAKFTVAATGNAAAQNHDTTVIQYGTTAEAKSAELLAQVFPGATVEKGSTAGLTVVLGKDYAAANGGAPAASAAAPAPLPSSIANNARSADDDPCANVSYN